MATDPDIIDFDQIDATTYNDELPATSYSSTTEEAASKALDNFAPKEANYSISHRLIPIMSFMTQWEERLREWVSIPEGMKIALVPDQYFSFWTNTFEKSIRYSASRKGHGREQIMEVLSSYLSGGLRQMGLMQTVKEKFNGVRDKITGKE